jgi:hypothetical protein
MLPGVLSANLCSLLGGVERYAVSVTWELHPETFKVPVRRKEVLDHRRQCLFEAVFRIRIL